MSSFGVTVRGPRGRQILVVIANAILGTMAGWISGLFLENFGVIAVIGLVGLVALLLLIAYTRQIDLIAIAAVTFLVTSLIAAAVSNVAFDGDGGRGAEAGNSPRSSLPTSTSSEVHPPPPTTSSTVTVTPVATVRVLGNRLNGIQVQISRSGTYRFEYVDGAYSVWPLGKVPTGTDPWLTSVIVFKGKSAPFDGKVLRKSDAILWVADNDYSADRDEAVAKARAYPGDQDVDLVAGDVITLVGVDEIQAYADNPGTVTIRMSFVTFA